MADEKKSNDKKKKRVAAKRVEQSNAISKYFSSTRGELRKVTWPTRKEAARLMWIVLGVTAVFALFLWAFDAMFSSSLQLLLKSII